MKHFHHPTRRTATIALLFGAAALAGCGSSDSGTTFFTPISTRSAAAAVSPIKIHERFMVYLASEASTGPAGTNINTDADLLDDCAVVVNMATKSETRLPIDTLDFEIVQGPATGSALVYLVVSEAQDGVDWNVDADMTDTVLLCWNSTNASTTFVDVIEDEGKVALLQAGDRLYYSVSDSTVLANGETTLRYVNAAAPTTPVTVLAVDTLNTHKPRLIGVDEGLIFLFQDEVVEGRDCNTDADATDGFVLALLDGTDPAAMFRSVELAVEDDSTPLRAKNTAAHDWLVAFLVSEAAQSNAATGLNDPTNFPSAWIPLNCPGYTDTDTTDNVLHFLEFANWNADGVVVPTNTGLVGHDRVIAVTGAVATIALESEDGACDLNADGDTTDNIVRWVKTTTPTLPFVSSTELVALEDSVPGGLHGLTDLSNKLIAVVSESDDDRDHDGDALLTHDLVAWLDPVAVAPTWVFDHGTSTGIQAAGASWIGERTERDRTLVAFQESVFGGSINSGGDADLLDSSPTFARFDPANASDFDFAGPAVACNKANPGMAIANGVAFYRVDEADDNRDWNGDGFKNDQVLFRTSLSNNFSKYVGVLNTLAGPAIVNIGTIGAAYLADEVMANVDFNGDGQIAGFTVRWMRVGS